jgi:hypothetical protein
VIAAADLPVGGAEVLTGPCTASLALRTVSRLRLAAQQVPDLIRGRESIVAGKPVVELVTQLGYPTYASRSWEC